jgi:hypothetical protein
LTKTAVVGGDCAPTKQSLAFFFDDLGKAPFALETLGVFDRQKNITNSILSRSGEGNVDIGTGLF